MKLNMISKLLPLFVQSAKDIGGGDGGDGGRIIGGEPASAADFFVSGYGTPSRPDQTGFICGAQLIASDVFLTAAHCDDGFQAGDTVAIGGLQFNGTDGESRTIDQIVVHPDYVPVPEDELFQPANDIKLFRISRPSVGSISPWNTDPAVPAFGDSVQAMGFGDTDPVNIPDGETEEIPGNFSDFLQKVEFPVRDNSVCNETFGTVYNSSIMICGGETGAMICGGDSGSPIFDSTERIVGLVSFGNAATCDTAAGFTRVSAFNTWIKTEMCNLSNDPPNLCEEGPTQSPPDNGINILPIILATVAVAAASVGAFFLGGWLDPFESSSSDDRVRDRAVF